MTRVSDAAARARPARVRSDILGDERRHDTFGATEEGIGEVDEDESGVLEGDEWGRF